MPVHSLNFIPRLQVKNRTELARSIARQLGVEENGVTALYFADTHDWEFVIGEQPLKLIGKDVDQPGLAEWEKSLQSQATDVSERMIALAEKRATADKPVTESQKNYFRVAAMLEELVEGLSSISKP